MKPAGRSLALLLVLAATPAARAQDPAADDFERHVLGPNWIVLAGAAAIIGDSDLGVAGSGGCAVQWAGSAFGADQLSETEISTDIDPEMLLQVFVRRRAADGARYAFHWNGDPGMDRWEIKYDGVPSAQTRILASAGGSPPMPGDRIRIEVEGASPVTIRGYYEGSLFLLATDAAPQRIASAGPPGVVTRPRQGSTPTPPVPVFESWSGGTLTPEILCRRGGVGLETRPEPAIVLTVNGGAGSDVLRELRVPRRTPITVALEGSPDGPAEGGYALWVWTNAAPGARDLSVGETPVGCAVAPTPFHAPEGPQPRRCVRGGLGPEFCGAVREIAGAPASTPWSLVRRNGFGRAIVFTLQGVLEDFGSESAAGLSPTNAIVLAID